MRMSFVQINWRHAGGEASLIVLSVLLALWANAARESYQDRLTERRYISSLTAEFSKTSADVRETIRWLQHTREVARQLIDLRVLRSEALRMALAAFDQSVERNDIYQRDLHQFFLESFDPFMRANVPLVALGIDGVPAGEFRLQPADLLHRRDFEYLMVARIGFGLDMENSAQAVLDAVERILVMLKSGDV